MTSAQFRHVMLSQDCVFHCRNQVTLVLSEIAEMITLTYRIPTVLHTSVIQKLPSDRVRNVIRLHPLLLFPGQRDGAERSFFVFR